MIHAQADPRTVNGAIRRVAKEPELSCETMRTLVSNYKNSGATGPAQSIYLKAENKRLHAELAETKRAHEILKKGATFFAV